MQINTGYLTASKTDESQDDTIGKIFGKLTVIRRIENGKGYHKRYECLCECGKYTYVYKSNLTRGLTTSCGCNHKQMLIERNKRFNTFINKGNCIEGYDSNENIFKFDVEDFDIVKNFCWVKTKNGYFTATDKGKHRIYLHRTILNIKERKVNVDHINHDASDNRKSNLRVASQSENSANQKIRSNNTSGIKGVSFDKKKRKWIAYGMKNYKHIYLGYFDDINSANDRRKLWEKEVQKEFAYDKRLDVINNG